MSIAASVAPQLPFLRRYARALTGRQDLGDAKVAAVLEALVADPDRLGDDEPRQGLFRLFTELWHADPVAAGPDREADSVADRRLDAMTPLPRQAFLLTAMEGFALDEAAAILGLGEEEVGALLTEAGRQIGAQVATRVLIIEDEPIIAMELETLVQSLGHAVIGNARTRDEALRLVEKEQPGLVLADIQLADGSSGLDAVNQILGLADMPVIFITAYPEFLLTGQRPEPTFLITKPFRDEMIRAVVSQALFFDTRPTGPARPS